MPSSFAPRPTWPARYRGWNKVGAEVWRSWKRLWRACDFKTTVCPVKLIHPATLQKFKVDTVNIAEAEKNFVKLVDQVHDEGISVDLERDNKVIARLKPVEPQSQLTIGQLNLFLSNLPSLHDDADKFSRDVRAIRDEFPAGIY